MSRRTHGARSNDFRPQGNEPAFDAPDPRAGLHASDGGRTDFFGAPGGDDISGNPGTEGAADTFGVGDVYGRDARFRPRSSMDRLEHRRYKYPLPGRKVG